MRTRGIRIADWGGGGRGDDSGELGGTERLWGTQRVGGSEQQSGAHVGQGGSDDGGGQGERVKRL